MEFDKLGNLSMFHLPTSFAGSRISAEHMSYNQLKQDDKDHNQHTFHPEAASGEACILAIYIT